MTDLAARLYTKWRSKQPDPYAHPVWGNLDTKQRAAWAGVEEEATDWAKGPLPTATFPTELTEEQRAKVLDFLRVHNVTLHAVAGEWRDAASLAIAPEPNVPREPLGGWAGMQPNVIATGGVAHTLYAQGAQVDKQAFVEAAAKLNREAEEYGVLVIEHHITDAALLDQVREGQRELNELGAKVCGLDVVAAAEAVRDHRCVNWTSSCSAGDHDDCGLREKWSALDDAVDAMREARAGLVPE